jgi:hypothetical protein
MLSFARSDMAALTQEEMGGSHQAHFSRLNQRRESRIAATREVLEKNSTARS